MNLLSPHHIASIAIAVLMQFRFLLQTANMMPLVASRSILTKSHRRNNWPAASTKCLLRRRQFTINVCDSISAEGRSRAVARSDGAARALAFLPAAPFTRERRGSAPSKRIPPPRYVRRHSTRKNPPPGVSAERRDPNRYERFRRCLASVSEDALADDPRRRDGRSFGDFGDAHLLEVGKCAVEVLSSNRRSFNRTWKRMRPLMELMLLARAEDGGGGCGENHDDVEKSRKSRRMVSSVADVGCDHGILSISLACMAWASRQGGENQENQPGERENAEFFSRVFGTDISSQALENGGFVSLKKISDAMMRTNREGGGASECAPQNCPLPIQFRLGRGLEPLRPGEADAVVLAGMGVHTMLDVLFGRNEMPDNAFPVDFVRTQYIFLQPTNSRPQHMMILYDRLQKCGGWMLRGESIAFLGGRWYVNAFFERRNKGDPEHSFHFPGQCLRHDSDYHAYDTYVNHHLQWLKEVYEQPKGLLVDEDKRWLEYIISSEGNDRWKSLASWYIQ